MTSRQQSHAHDIHAAEIPGRRPYAAGGAARALFYEFDLTDPPAFVEERLERTVLGQDAAVLAFVSIGVLHGAQSMVVQQEDGSTAQVSSVASETVYPDIGPEIAMQHRKGRLNAVAIADDEVLRAFFHLT